MTNDEGREEEKEEKEEFGGVEIAKMVESRRRRRDTETQEGLGRAAEG